MPIDLLSFEGECIDNKTHIEFVVASQVNNEYFTIERSKNLFDWNEISHIPGGGTNNEEITYNFTDLSPLLVITIINYPKQILMEQPNVLILL